MNSHLEFRSSHLKRVTRTMWIWDHVDLGPCASADLPSAHAQRIKLVKLVKFTDTWNSQRP